MRKVDPLVIMILAVLVYIAVIYTPIYFQNTKTVNALMSMPQEKVVIKPGDTVDSLTAQNLSTSEYPAWVRQYVFTKRNPDVRMDAGHLLEAGRSVYIPNPPE